MAVWRLAFSRTFNMTVIDIMCIVKQSYVSVGISFTVSSLQVWDSTNGNLVFMHAEKSSGVLSIIVLNKS